MPHTLSRLASHVGPLRPGQRLIAYINDAERLSLAPVAHDDAAVLRRKYPVLNGVAFDVMQKLYDVNGQEDVLVVMIGGS